MCSEYPSILRSLYVNHATYIVLLCLHNNYVSSNIYVHSHRHNIVAGTKLFRKKKITLEVTAMRAAVFVLGLLCIIPVLLASANQLYIRPSEEDPCAGEPCYLLSHVLQNAREYLTSNTLVILTHGNYFVSEDMRVVINDVHNLTLTGSNTGSTVVNCSKHFSIIAAYSTKFVISNLNFLNCTHTYLQHGIFSVRMTLGVIISNVTLSNTSFNSSTGSSIFAISSNLEFLGRTAFKENHCVIGCGIVTFVCNIAFHGEVVF